jgi:hypothetical protein
MILFAPCGDELFLLGMRGCPFLRLLLYDLDFAVARKREGKGKEGKGREGKGRGVYSTRHPSISCSFA